MDYLNNTINTLPRERGQHLRFEDRCEIKAISKVTLIARLQKHLIAHLVLWATN